MERVKKSKKKTISKKVNTQKKADKNQADKSIKIKFDQLRSRGCGFDIHKKIAVASIAEEGIKPETKTFTTFTQKLEKLRDWLKEKSITHVAMESTGVYWKQIYNILEFDFEIILVNARHIKHVPGKKTET